MVIVVVCGRMGIGGTRELSFPFPGSPGGRGLMVLGLTRVGFPGKVK